MVSYFSSRTSGPNLGPLGLAPWVSLVLRSFIKYLEVLYAKLIWLVSLYEVLPLHGYLGLHGT